MSRYAELIESVEALTVKIRETEKEPRKKDFQELSKSLLALVSEIELFTRTPKRQNDWLTDYVIRLNQSQKG